MQPSMSSLTSHISIDDRTTTDSTDSHLKHNNNTINSVIVLDQVGSILFSLLYYAVLLDWLVFWQKIRYKFTLVMREFKIKWIIFIRYFCGSFIISSKIYLSSACWLNFLLLQSMKLICSSDPCKSILLSKLTIIIAVSIYDSRYRLNLHMFWIRCRYWPGALVTGIP
jgi:hypothetical protein